MKQDIKCACAAYDFVHALGRGRCTGEAAVRAIFADGGPCRGCQHFVQANDINPWTTCALLERYPRKGYKLCPGIGVPQHAPRP